MSAGFDVVQILQEALWIVLLLSAPPIAVAVVLGLLISFIQSITQIQEQTIQFAVKMVAIIVTLFLTAGLLGGTMYRFGNRMFSEFPRLIGG